ncbi:hypothetical protein PHMEG_00019159 [Phytophthora megakarya]|uniref:Uncharacterized protein n=1 Tax=Phytophthora megakarya TaxID=4795 RepID=A0A225VTI8_9STRA|nr:hypothetical protein PHMEG_00019159 [Phytophthora megakarya]
MWLPDTRCRHMTPFIDLEAGMPVQVTQNVLPTKGVVNGTLGLLKRIILSSQIISKRFEIVTLGWRGPNAASFDSTEDTAVFSVFPNTIAYSKFSIAQPNEPTAPKRIISLRLHQLPIISAFFPRSKKYKGNTTVQSRCWMEASRYHFEQTPVHLSPRISCYILPCVCDAYVFFC